MNWDIYINQILERLGLLFYNQYIIKKGSIIWMNNGAYYHMSKMTTMYYHYIRLICIDQPVQSLDFNPIENLQCIIKIQVSAQCHQIHLLKFMKEIIKKEQEKLIEKDFYVCINNMPKQCKLVIEAWGRSIKY